MIADEHILLVDDDVDYTPLIVVALRKAGFAARVEVVHEGGSAVQRLQRGAPPRLLLLDLRMPGLSGVDLLRWVREREELRQLLVVVLTGSNNRRELDEALAAGADVLLLKPFRFEDLVRQFKELRAMLEERPGRGTTSDCGAGRLMAAA